jgi:hypothetical protein
MGLDRDFVALERRTTFQRFAATGGVGGLGGEADHLLRRLTSKTHRQRTKPGRRHVAQISCGGDRACESNRRAKRAGSACTSRLAVLIVAYISNNKRSSLALTSVDCRARPRGDVVQPVHHRQRHRPPGACGLSVGVVDEAEAAPAPRKHGWSPNALQLILANPAYRGLIRWNDTIHQGLHEPLVDEETFERAQAILARRHQHASLRRGNPTDFLLSGLVRCHHCGRAYVGTSAHGNGGRYTYYTTRYKYGPSKCEGDRLPKARLEDAVLTQLAGIYRDQRLIEQALADAAERSERDRPQLEEALAGCRAEIARTERKLDRYYQAFERGELSASDCHERVHGHRARLETLREQEAALSRRLATHADEPPDTAALTALADHLHDIIASEGPEQAKELLRLLIKEIRVHNRRRILPIYRVPTAVRAIPRKVGGTGLEPVTPSLSIRSSVRLSSLMFAQSASLSGIRLRANT